MTASLIPLKHLASLNPDTLDENTDPKYTFHYVDISTTGRGQLREKPQLMRFASAPSRARRVLKPGDTILSTVRTYLRAAWTVRDVADHLIASTGFVCLRPRVTVDPRFLGWVAQADTVVEEIVARSVGVNYPAISPSEIGRIKVPQVPLSRQRAIADYLDRETARIDALIAAKRRLGDLLTERLQRDISASTHAQSVVTPSHPLPDGWKLMSLRRCLRETAYGIGEATQADGEYPVLGMSNISAGEVVGAPGGFVSAVDSSHLLAPGDLLFNRTNSRELVGKVGLVRSLDRPTTFASYLVRLKVAPRADARYLNYLLNAPEILGIARSMALPSIGQANLNPSRYAAMLLPIPPIDEQRRLVVHLDALASRTASISGALARQVTLLQEHRQALITAAIAGDVDIREAA